MSELGPNPLAAGERNIAVDDERNAIRSALVPIEGDEEVSLRDAVGRVWPSR